MISAKIVIALGGSPRDRQARHDGSRPVSGTMRGKHGGRDAIGIDAVMGIAVEGAKTVLPATPVGDIGIVCASEAGLQTCDSTGCSFIFGLAETERQRRGVMGIAKIDFRSQRNIAVIRPLEFLNEASVPAQLLPAIGDANKSRTCGAPGTVADQSEIS